MAEKFYIDAQGNFLGAFDGTVPIGGSEVPNPPPINATQKYANGAWQSPPVPTTYQLSKATAWRRMTSDEAQQVDAVMMETDAQMRQIYLAAQYLSTGDDLWTTLWGILADLFGQTRTAQILAPET